MLGSRLARSSFARALNENNNVSSPQSQHTQVSVATLTLLLTLSTQETLCKDHYHKDTMSPIKRALSERSPDAAFLESRPKRLRGGGGDDEDEWGGSSEPQDLFDDDLMQEEEEQPVPDELDTATPAVVTDAQVEQHGQRWRRPALKDTSRETDRNVQWLDMDVVSGRPLERNPNSAKKAVVGSQKGQVPILRCFGVDEEGHSMAVFIHGFTPYAYFALPEGYEFTGDASDLAKIRDNLTTRLESAARGQMAQAAAVLGVTYIKDHKSIMGYETPHTRFLKVFVTLPGLVSTLKRIMEEGIDLPGVENTGAGESGGMMPAYQPFECNVPFVLRFMVDRDLGGAGWLSLPGKTYQIRDEAKKETHCQVCTDSVVDGWLEHVC